MEKDKDEQNFFSKLGNFCHLIEKDLSNLHKADNFSGRNPRDYAMAMGTLRGNVMNLKQQSDECEQKFASWQSFDEFVKSLDEQVESKSNQLRRMEEFLKKFGYNIPEVEIIEEIVNSNDEDIHQTEANFTGTPSSPIIISLPKRALADNGNKNLESEETYTPKSQSEMDFEDEEIPKLSHSSVEQWLDSCSDPSTFTPASVKNLSINSTKNWNISITKKTNAAQQYIDNTPKLKSCKSHPQAGYLFDCDSQSIVSLTQTPVQRHYNFSLKECEEEQKDCEKNYFHKDAHNNLVDKTQINTPEEPTISNFGQSICKLELEPKKFHTPEDPILSSVGTDLITKTFSSDVYTHGEDFHTPEEPVLNSASNNKLEDSPQHDNEGNLRKFSFDILASPVISSVTAELLSNMREMKFPLEVKGDENRYCKSVETGKQIIEKLPVIEPPESPQLSDITMQIINRK